ncbi:LacI family DNA-binding transcriptional regulator [Paenibacillus lemnae]|uniref:LacI family transcriptional regulator n=1 Tax=Paenibacillus lemnae TaxID=1330551 RepID=A0A848M5Q1_PAELE|nr:LacI family DNA-binding transcriptional regulator [Paenibacillus lemnae]NMO95432.1 LacI family transcriptional regulator [Paenibacillus lemnae]
MRKATMKDIAREAGVSVATVSYILNKVNNQTITEETRRRVLDAAGKLNYVPSLTARSLVKGKSGMLGLLYNRSGKDGFWKQLYYGYLSERMEDLCKRKGYHLLVLGLDADQPNLDIVQQREIDGVLLVDVKKEVFLDISVHFDRGVPVVLMDSMIDDPLFHKIIFDFKTAFESWRNRNSQSGEKGFLVMSSYVNEGMAEEIRLAASMDPDKVFILDADNQKELNDFLQQNQGNPGVIINEFAALQVSRVSHHNSHDLTVFCTSGCPDVLPPGMKTLMMEHPQKHVESAFQIMEYYIKSRRKASDRLDDGGPFEQYVSISLG